MAGFNRYGVKEDNPRDGTFMETYGLNLGGGNISRETLTYGADATLVALEVTRPLGIVFEDVNGECVAVEVIEGSNASTAGVIVGDVLRMTSAVAIGKSTVTVGNLQVEPSLAMRKKGVEPKSSLRVRWKAVQRGHGRHRQQRGGGGRRGVTHGGPPPGEKVVKRHASDEDPDDTI